MTFIDDLNPDRFLVAGDWHAGRGQALAALTLMEQLGDDVKVLVHVGDFFYDDRKFLNYVDALLDERGMTILFVDGNHEDFNYLYSVPLEDEGFRFLRERIIHLPRGFRWEWGGLKFAALGGAHSVDKDMRKPGKEWWVQEWVNDHQLEKFREGGLTDVVFMHDSPAGAPNAVVDDPINQGRAVQWFGDTNLALAAEHRRRLTTAIDPTDPSLIIHGHYHKRMLSEYWREGGRRCTVLGLDEGMNGVNLNTFLFDVPNELTAFGRDYTDLEKTE